MSSSDHYAFPRLWLVLSCFRMPFFWKIILAKGSGWNSGSPNILM